jgi:signal transduction histidine kinase
MSSIDLRKISGRIGIRLTFWYSGMIFAVIVILFTMSHFFLSTTLKSRDRMEVQSEISEMGSELVSSGVEGLEQFVKTHLSKRLKEILFIRAVDTRDTTAYEYSPFPPETFDIKKLENSPVRDGEWLSFSHGNGNLRLDVLTVFLENGDILQVGMSNKNRLKTLYRFRRLFFTGMIPLIVVCFILGIILSTQTLTPLRHIIKTVENIDIGKMDSRVPRTGTGDELDELARLFNEMLEKINRLIQGMKDSLDNLAHDLRTPLTRLRNISENALFTLPAQGSGREAHESILEESERIMSMMDTLMDISEAETGVMNLKRKDMPLTELVYPIYDLYLMVAEAKRITMSYHIPPSLKIFADPDRIGQVVANLLDNAIKFTPEGGTVRLSAHANHPNTVIEVCDTGVGIPTHDMDRIWDRLYRGDRSRSQKGLGLGLSLVKAIVTAHEGSIDVVSDTSGTSFSLSLPPNPFPV